MTPRGFLTKHFTSSACGAASGIIAGHAGCAAMPLAAAAGIAYSSVAGLALSFSVAAGGYALWHKLRNAKAAKTEKSLALLGLAGGAALTLSAHFAPAQQAAHWLEDLSPQERQTITQAAKTSGFGLRDYALMMCRPAD